MLPVACEGARMHMHSEPRACRPVLIATAYIVCYRTNGRPNMEDACINSYM